MGIEPTTVCLQGNLATLDHATPYKLSGDERARTAVQLKYQNTFYMLIQLIDFGFPTLNWRNEGIRTEETYCRIFGSTASILA